MIPSVPWTQPPCCFSARAKGGRGNNLWGLPGVCLFVCPAPAMLLILLAGHLSSHTIRHSLGQLLLLLLVQMVVLLLLLARGGVAPLVLLLLQMLLLLWSQLALLLLPLVFL